MKLLKSGSLWLFCQLSLYFIILTQNVNTLVSVHNTNSPLLLEFEFPEATYSILAITLYSKICPISAGSSPAYFISSLSQTGKCKGLKYWVKISLNTPSAIYKTMIDV